jgi:hypothetical protein
MARARVKVDKQLLADALRMPEGSVIEMACFAFSIFGDHVELIVSHPSIKPENDLKVHDLWIERRPDGVSKYVLNDWPKLAYHVYEESRPRHSAGPAFAIKNAHLSSQASSPGVFDATI